MRRIVTKNWKVIAYITGFVLLALSPLEDLTVAYGLVGTAYGFIRFVMRVAKDGVTVSNTNGVDRFSDKDDRSPQPFGRDYGTLNANDATVIYSANCP